MRGSGNGARPHKSSEEVAADLRQRLEGQLGPERTEAIWRDPANIQDVVQGEEEAAAVAGIILGAWRELPAEETSGRARRRSGFRRGLRLALIAAFAVWALSTLKRVRPGRGEEGEEPL